MKLSSKYFNGLKVISGKNYYDNRGFFREIYKKKILKKNYIFWCVSKSKKNILRGLHIQRKIKQKIFISVVKGKIFDVVVDLRKNSKTFGMHSTNILSQKNALSLVIPDGFAHGFYSLDNENIILYGISNYRSKKYETGIIWNDESLKIKWPTKKPKTSIKDKRNISFKKYCNLYI